MRKLLVTCFIGILFCLTACQKKTVTDEPTPKRYRPVEALLARHQPDSAYNLMRTLEPNLFEIPEKNRYHAYALWAQALDDANESLIPCEMLLAEALAFHQEDDYLRGKILYYQARLLDEKRFIPPVIDYYLRALQILKNYPEEKHRLSVIYNRTGYYYLQITEPDKAKEAFLNAYQVDTVKSYRIRALKKLGDLYRVRKQKDSAMLYLNEGLRYARECRDSSNIATLLNLIAYTHNYFGETDSAARYDYAMFYPEETDSYYYTNRGHLFWQEEQYDSARYYFNKSLQQANGDTEIRLSNYKWLAKSYQTLGNYQEAIRYLELRNELADSLYFINMYPKSNINLMTHKMIGDITVEKEHIRHLGERNKLIIFTSLFILLLVILYQWQLYRKKMIQLQQKATIASLQYEDLALQDQILKQKEIIDSLNKAHDKDLKKISQSETLLEQLEKRQEQLTLNLFKQTKSYQIISSIQAHNLKNKENPKVLTEKQQTELTDTLLQLFREPINEMKRKYPRLTDGDITYYYLEKLQYEATTIAYCFGKTDPNSIYQRRKRFKERTQEDFSII